MSRRHSKMAVSRHLGYYRTGNSAIRSAGPPTTNNKRRRIAITPSVCNKNKKPQLTLGLRAARQRRHSKMAVSRHLGYYRTSNSSIRSAGPENRCLELDMEWIRCTICEIFAFKLYCDLESWVRRVRGHGRSSKVALFDTVHVTLYSSSLVTMPLSSTLSEI